MRGGPGSVAGLCRPLNRLALTWPPPCTSFIATVEEKVAAETPAECATWQLRSPKPDRTRLAGMQGRAAPFFVSVIPASAGIHFVQDQHGSRVPTLRARLGMTTAGCYAFGPRSRVPSPGVPMQIPDFRHQSP